MCVFVAMLVVCVLYVSLGSSVTPNICVCSWIVFLSICRCSFVYYILHGLVLNCEAGCFVRVDHEVVIFFHVCHCCRYALVAFLLVCIDVMVMSSAYEGGCGMSDMYMLKSVGERTTS